MEYFTLEGTSGGHLAQSPLQAGPLLIRFLKALPNKAQSTSKGV